MVPALRPLAGTTILLVQSPTGDPSEEFPGNPMFPDVQLEGKRPITKAKPQYPRATSAGAQGGERSNRTEVGLGLPSI
jgi:hypothetical protein